MRQTTEDRRQMTDKGKVAELNLTWGFETTSNTINYSVKRNLFSEK